MHVVVLGAGVIGVTTAYYLSRAGCRVTVLDRAQTVASGASHANGGQLSYSFTDALAKPTFLTRLPRIVLGGDPAIRFRPPFDRAFAAWSAGFLRQCTSRRATKNTLAMLKLALRSGALLEDLRRDVPIEFAYRKAGKIVLTRHPQDMKRAAKTRDMKARHGCATQLLSVAEAIAIEPAISRMDADFIGAVFSAGDDVADAAAFSSALSQWLITNSDTTFRLGENVSRLVTHANRAVAVDTDDDRIEAGAFVVCLGAWSPSLLQPHGINPPIYPVRGYSVTLPLGEAAPAVSITDLDNKIVFSRLNGGLRIAGFADFVGFDEGSDRTRVAMLLDVARGAAPAAAHYDAASVHEWGGFRPLTPSGQPLTGATSIAGLYLNTGHGMLGWTMACGSGFDTAGAVANQSRHH